MDIGRARGQNLQMLFRTLNEVKVLKNKIARAKILHFHSLEFLFVFRVFVFCADISESLSPTAHRQQTCGSKILLKTKHKKYGKQYFRVITLESAYFLL